MAADPNPQARQMADESMVRTLAAQAAAVWPQERELLRRYGLSGRLRVLDGGCGTGEATGRFATLWPEAEVLGVDILEVNLDLARRRHAALAPRVRFEHRSLFELGLPSDAFDLVACRHVLQSIPEAEKAIAELVRVTRPGGRVHLLAEDYGMIHFTPRRFDPDDTWPPMAIRFGNALGIDLRVGRRAPSILQALGLKDVTVDYVVVDTLRVPRETLADIWIAWRDGYVDVIAEQTGQPADDVRARFDDQIATLRDPAAYACWMVPVVAGLKEGARRAAGGGA